MGGGDRLGKNAELSIPDFAGEPYFLGNLQKCFFSMRALFPFIFPEILIQAKQPRETRDARRDGEIAPRETRVS